MAIPDINVWLALATDHIHHATAVDWWERYGGSIGFCRMTQVGFLRLLTTAAVMNGRPLQMKQAWRVYDELSADERVDLLTEPLNMEQSFRGNSSTRLASPKLWVDAYLSAFANESQAELVTFNVTLAKRGKAILLR